MQRGGADWCSEESMYVHAYVSDAVEGTLTDQVLRIDISCTAFHMKQLMLWTVDSVVILIPATSPLLSHPCC